MIKFALVCQGGHEFESWFQSGSAFEMQLKSQLLECPHCQTIEVSKAIMAPAVSKRRGEAEVLAPDSPAALREPPEPGLPVTQGVPEALPSPTPGPLLDEQSREFRHMIAAFHQKLQADAVNVGADFAEEARRIHDGKAEKRLILGQATFEDARALLEEGISIIPVPPLPEDFN